jgi:large subunit ribosomal protein L14
MIQQQTILKVSDNSGANTVKCIKVLGGFQRKYAKIGDIIIVSIQNLRINLKKVLKIKKKEIYKALIIRTKTNQRKKNGFSLTLNENSVVLINKNGNPIGTRIIGPLPKFLRTKKLQKFFSISNGTV